MVILTTRPPPPDTKKTLNYAIDQGCKNSGSLFARHTKFRTMPPAQYSFPLHVSVHVHWQESDKTTGRFKGHSRNVSPQNGICSCSLLKSVGSDLHYLPWTRYSDNLHTSTSANNPIDISTQSQLHAALFVEKLRVPQTLKNFSALYGTRLFITILTKARHFPYVFAVLCVYCCFLL